MQALGMAEGLIVHQSVYAAAKLGIANLLKDRERSITELATILQVKEDALYRVLRFGDLHSARNGVVEQE